MKLPEISIVNQGIWNNPGDFRRTPSRFALCYELEYQRKACGETTINGVTYPIKENMLIFTRPGDLRSSAFDVAARAETEFFYFSLDGDAPVPWFDTIPPVTYADQGLSLQWQALAATRSDASEPLQKIDAHLELLRLLTALSRRGASQAPAHTEPSPKQRILFEAIRYMHEHLGESPSLADIASHIGYSLSHFNHLFKAYTRHTPHAYYISLKLEEAKRRLAVTDKSIAVISDELGFDKTSRFSAAFKKAYGMTPREFRKAGGVIYNG